MIYEGLFRELRNFLDLDSDSLIALVGLPGSGKSTLSINFGKYAQEQQGIACIPFEGDIYSTSSRENRNAMIETHWRTPVREGGTIDPDWPRQAYHYNIPLLSEHLQKFKRRENFAARGLCHPKKKSLDLELQVKFLDYSTVDVKLDNEKSTYTGHPTWLLADWALFTKQGVREKFDTIVYVDASFDVRAARIQERLSKLPKPIKREEGLLESIEASQIHDFDIYPDLAHIVIDNNDYSNPKIISVKKVL